MTPPTFDPDESARKRDEAIERVDASHDEWCARTHAAIAEVARRQKTLTTDDVWALVTEDAPREPRAMGAAMRRASAAGMIQPLDEWQHTARVAAHRRPLRVWASLVFSVPPTVSAPQKPRPVEPTLFGSENGYD